MKATSPSTLAKKLNLKDGMKLRVVGKPGNLNLAEIAGARRPDTNGVIVFVKKLADVESRCTPAIGAAREDRLAWIAYPKAGQLGTDINRDILWARMAKHRVEPVRIVALDDVWSAMRFRPAK